MSSLFVVKLYISSVEMIFVFLIFNCSPALALSSLIFIRSWFKSLLLSASEMVSSAYLNFSVLSPNLYFFLHLYPAQNLCHLLDYLISMTLYFILFLIVFSYPSVLISFLAVFAIQFFVLFVVIMTSFISLRTINILILKLFLYSSTLFYLDRFYLLITDFIDYFY